MLFMVFLANLGGFSEGFLGYASLTLASGVRRNILVFWVLNGGPILALEFRGACYTSLRPGFLSTSGT